MSDSEIVNSISGQTIFLTGGTGFLGKVLVEKLLRVCQVKAIYLLVRPKKGKTVEDRIEEYFDSLCFQSLKEQNQSFKEKINFVNGDCEKPNLGICKDTEEMLIENTTIVIHAAANVKFDQSLRSAANSILRCTMDILELTKKMSKLKSFIYVSTAYSNCPHKTIEETVYYPPMTPKQLFSLLDGISDDAVLDKITPKLLKQWPNTYTFAKSIAEYHLACEGQGLPLGIVRPGIVTVSEEEPMPGWVDNVYGVIGITLSLALGILRCVNIEMDAHASLVPCDYVCNNILAAHWDIATEKSTNVKFYNICTSKKNLLPWGKYTHLMKEKIYNYPSTKMVWHYIGIGIKHYTWHKYCRFFLQTIWAYLVDFVLICVGRKPEAVKIYKTLDKLTNAIAYFTTREWNFITDNRDNLWKKMNLVDQKMFNFNMNHLDWPSHVENVILGCRVYLLKDPLKTVPIGKDRMKKLKIAHYTLTAMLLFFLYTFCKFVIYFFIQ